MAIFVGVNRTFMNMPAYGKRLFEELTNCPDENIDEDGYFMLGETRYVEVREFIIRFMQSWVTQPQFSTAHLSLSPIQLQSLYKKRFCTYPEYEKLFSSVAPGNFDAPIFIILGIDDEQKHKKYKTLFGHDPDGYFRLMKTLNPSLGTFFFPAVLAQNP